MKIMRFNILFVFLIIPLLFVFSCEKMESPYLGAEIEDEAGMDIAIKSEEMVGPMAPPAPSTGEAPAPEIDLKAIMIIKSAELELKVDDFLETFETVQDIVDSEGGFIADSSTYKSEEDTMSGEVKIRVRPDRFVSLIDKIKVLGDLEYQRISGEDITREYYDLEARLKSKEDTEKRLLELLAKQTRSVKDILEVEIELGRVREEIESMKGTLRYYDNLVGLSTVNLNMYEPEPLALSASRIFGPIREALRDSLVILSESFAAMIYFIMVVIPWVVLGICLFYIIRAIVRKNRKKKEEIKKKKK
jgi:hypothetical protein